MEQLKPLVCVLADGTAPADGSAPLRPFEQPLRIPMRVDLQIPLVFKRANKTIPDITGWTIFLAVTDAVTGEQRIQRSVPVEDIDGPNGTAIVTINRGDTSGAGGLASDSPGLYDVFALDTSDTPFAWKPVEQSPWVPATSSGDPGGDVTPPADGVALIGLPADIPTNGSFDLVVFNGVMRARQHERAVATFNGLSAQASANWPTFDGRPFRAVVSCAQTDDVEALNPQLVADSLNDFSCVIQIANSEAECEVVIDLLEELS